MSTVVRDLIAANPGCCRSCVVGDHVKCPNLFCRCGREGHVRQPSSGSALALAALRDESGQREGIVPDQTQPEGERTMTSKTNEGIVKFAEANGVVAGEPRPKQPRKRSRGAARPTQDQTPEQRSAVAKVVKPGEASSKRKAAEAKAKVAANAEKVAKLNKADAAAAKALADARAAIAEAKTTPVTPAAARIQRLAQAKAEAKAVKEWEAAGSKGERPATPALDAMESKAPVVSAAADSTRGPRSEHGRLAAAEKKRTNDKRGKGVKLTDDELVEFVVGILTDNPSADRAEERQFAYWIGTGTAARPAGIALSGNDRWNDAWKKATAQVRSAK